MVGNEQRMLRRVYVYYTPGFRYPNHSSQSRGDPLGEMNQDSLQSKCPTIILQIYPVCMNSYYILIYNICNIRVYYIYMPYKPSQPFSMLRNPARNATSPLAMEVPPTWAMSSTASSDSHAPSW